MPALAVINGIYDRDICQSVEYAAFREGILSCRLEEYIRGRHEGQISYILFCIDKKGIEHTSKDMLKILAIDIPFLLVDKDGRLPFQTGGYRWETLAYPFKRSDFQNSLKKRLTDGLWNDRTMVFGSLEIDRGCRQVWYRNEKLPLKGFDYMIFLALAERMGSVVSRETINQYLPERRRSSLRNIDSHIKSIRRNPSIKEIIRAVRPIGYCLEAYSLYQEY